MDTPANGAECVVRRPVRVLRPVDRLGLVARRDRAQVRASAVPGRQHRAGGVGRESPPTGKG